MKFLATCILLCGSFGSMAHEWDFKDLGVYYSRPHEDLPNFMKRLGRVIQDYTDTTGHEVCGMISQKNDQFAVRLSSDGVQLGCSLDKQEVVEGFAKTGVYVHSHPTGQNDSGRRVLRVMSATAHGHGGGANVHLGIKPCILLQVFPLMIFVLEMAGWWSGAGCIRISKEKEWNMVPLPKMNKKAFIKQQRTLGVLCCFLCCINLRF